MFEPGDSPFLLPPQSVVSFSGGRTSGLMLRRVLDAFGGALPNDRKVIFCNTGKERPETLDFVQECSERWGVPIVWLEYRKDASKPIVRKGGNGQPAINRHSWTQVDYATASRDGRPFEELLDVFAEWRREVKDADPVLPNVVQRFCTVEMKIRTAGRYLVSIGWNLSETTDAVGLRADEPRRIAKQKATHERRTDALVCGHLVSPLGEAGITEADVMAFWASQPFDLALQQDEGNCDACFLKASTKLIRIFQKRPDLADWWIEQEERTGQVFRKDRPNVRELVMIAKDEMDGPGWLWSDKGNVGACGEVEECRCTD